MIDVKVHPKRGSFGDFEPPPAALAKAVPREKFAGLEPSAAAEAAMADYAAMRALEDSTRIEKTYVLARILRDLAEKGKDLATVEQATLAEYRAFLQDLVKQEKITENYAYNLVKEWNAMVSLLFGDPSRPGEGLKMKGFTQSPKQVEHLGMEEIERMVQELPHKRFQNEHYRRVAGIYLELATASAGRWDSLSNERLTFADIDYVAGTVRFRKVKNTDLHVAVLTQRCLAELRWHERFLRRTQHWRGPETPLLLGPRGEIPSYRWLESTLKELAALAGVQKDVTTHLFRKSVGTHIAKENPRLAREQLGITQKVFERHYNQPSVQDRIERRDLLMGSDPAESSELQARVGALYLLLRDGKVSQQEFDLELAALLGGSGGPHGSH